MSNQVYRDLEHRLPYFGEDYLFNITFVGNVSLTPVIVGARVSRINERDISFCIVTNPLQTLAADDTLEAAAGSVPEGRRPGVAHQNVVPIPTTADPRVPGNTFSGYLSVLITGGIILRKVNLSTGVQSPFGTFAFPLFCVQYETPS